MLFEHSVAYRSSGSETSRVHKCIVVLKGIKDAVKLGSKVHIAKLHRDDNSMQ